MKIDKNNSLYNKILSPWNTNIKIAQGKIEVDKGKKMLYLTTTKEKKKVWHERNIKKNWESRIKN